MTVEVTLQEQSHRIWSIIRLFYQALLLYREEYSQYEEKVLAHARERQQDRRDLRLSIEDLAALLDFKNLEALRNGYIHRLKDLCHLAFRTEDHTDLLDRYVSDIFHEISILKEEHYTLKTYGPMWERDEATKEVTHIVDEAHHMFPEKLTHIDYLFGKALKRMQELLPTFRSMPIVIRSLYLSREEAFVREAYPEGLHDFYRFMYTLGAFEGYYQVGLSFEQAGFREQAIFAFARAEGQLDDARREFARRKADAERDGVSVAELAAQSPRGPARDPDLTWRSIQAKVRRLEGDDEANGIVSSAEPESGGRRGATAAARGEAPPVGPGVRPRPGPEATPTTSSREATGR